MRPHHLFFAVVSVAWLASGTTAAEPKTAKDFFNRGVDRQRAGKFDEAIADYTEAIRLHPKDAKAWSYRGIAYVEKKEYDKAITDHTEAIRLDPKDATALNNRGSAWSEKKEYDKAIADYTEAIRLHPKSVTAFNDRAAAYHSQGKNDEALADLTEALRLDPKNATAFRNRGVVSLSQKKYDEALAELTQAIRLDPKYGEAFRSRGKVYALKGQLDESIADYTEAIRLAPESAKGYFERGVVREVFQKKYGLAVADYLEAVRLDPRDEKASRYVEDAVKKLRAAGVKPEVLSVTLDDEVKSVPTKKSPPYKLAANSEQVVDDTIRVKHEVRVTDSWKAEAEVRGTVRAWFVEVQTGVRSGIEKSTSRTYGVETERKRSVTIKGTGSEQGVRVVWVDLYRTGKAKVKIDGVTIEVPFDFRVDFELITEEAKDEMEKK